MYGTPATYYSDLLCTVRYLYSNFHDTASRSTVQVQVPSTKWSVVRRCAAARLEWGKKGGGKWWRLLTYISIFLYNCLSIQVPFFGHHFLVFLAYIIPVFPHLLFSPSALCLAWGFCLYFCLYLSPVFLSFIFAYHSANDLHSVFLFMIQFLCFFLLHNRNKTPLIILKNVTKMT